MKILKKSAQRNVPLLADFYTEEDIVNLWQQGYIFRHDEYDVWRVPLSICDSISVKFNREDGFYYTVVRANDGVELYVTL